MRIPSVEIAGIAVLALIVGLYGGVILAEETRTTVLPPATANGDGTISEARTKLVAVTRDGQGIVTNLSVRTVPGNGRILVDIESLLFFVDTQQSIQTAKRVAESYLNVTVTDRDIVYDIEVDNTSIVGGESAGGALTIATIAALSGRDLREDTVMTGTIDEDGAIGEIGGLAEKARAASEAGYRFFLVPEGQGTFTNVEKVKTCDRTGRTEVCTIEFKQTKASIGNETGITVVEVATIDDVVAHFIVGGSL